MLLVLALGSAGRGAESWGDFGAWRVRRTATIPPRTTKLPKLPKLDCCYVEFPTADLLAPEGRDLRVTVDGEEQPFKIIDIARDGTVQLVAPIPSAAKTMQIYYGNPQAKAAPQGWSPERGLWLETRRFKGGDCRSLDGIRAAWAKGERYGRGAVSHIFHGLNPYGPSDNYLSLYTGWIYVPRDTTVHFSVIADDIGHLLVDSEVVAAKTVPGRMSQHHRFTGKPVAMKQGLHLIQLYHFEASDLQAAGAEWWMQGMKRGEKFLHYQVIPPESYAPLRYGRLVNYEVRGQSLGADFTYVNAGDVLVDNDPRKMAVRIEFRDTSRPADRALQCQPQWDFGDGTTTESRDPNHVYLKHGDYTATLSLRRGGQTWKVTQKVLVGPGWQRTSRRQWDKLADYYPLIKDYQFDKMPTDHLPLAVRIFESLEKAEELIAAGQALLKRADALDDKSFVEHALLLGRHLREAEGKAREALAVFAAAEARTTAADTKARLANEKGDVYFYFLDDQENALAQYSRTVKEFAKASTTQVRLAQIRIGDVYGSKGDAKAARQAYERAADMPIHTRTELVESARRGSFARTVEDYTRRKLFREAHEELNNWDWEFPTDKMVGYSSLLRARLALAEGKAAEAEKQATQLLTMNRESEYADDLLLFLTDLHLRANKLDAAYAAASRLLKDHPASELGDEARLKRAAIRLRQAKYAEAAAEAMEVGRNEDSAQAPAALLLAATAHLRQNKRDDAVQALERLTKKHPTSGQATEGLKMLKELRRK